jgi:hypothetical protein
VGQKALCSFVILDVEDELKKSLAVDDAPLGRFLVLKLASLTSASDSSASGSSASLAFLAFFLLLLLVLVTGVYIAPALDMLQHVGWMLIFAQPIDPHIASSSVVGGPVFVNDGSRHRCAGFSAPRCLKKSSA